MGSPFTAADLAATDISDTERAVVGELSAAQVWSFFSDYAQDRVGSPISRVCFRAGRIDAVWGVELDDGREVVIKCHRLPTDVEAIAAADDAKRLLRATGFPCAEPLSGPDESHGRILSLETMMADGEAPDGRDPAVRRLLADGLARHIDLLRGRPDLQVRAGRGPSWCHYQDGPWPVPHDAIVNFDATPAGYAWLDTFGRQASTQILDHRTAGPTVVGHADWYGGNAAVADGVLVGTFDWELVADAEAVIAGFTAACYAASSTSGVGLSTPEEVGAFLEDYEAVRPGGPFAGQERRAAAGAAAWIIAFNARWQLAMQQPGDEDGATVLLARERRGEYLSLRW